MERCIVVHEEDILSSRYNRMPKVVEFTGRRFQKWV